nr:DUF4270 family protein [uncultured Carboxylicivirga sp.]
MNNRILKNIFSLILGQLLLIGLLSLSSCKDEPARLSGGVLPEGEVIRGLNEYIDLHSKNLMRDTVRTNDADYGLIGVFNDSVFGKTTADFVTNFSVGKRPSYTARIVTGSSTEDVDTLQFYKFNNNTPEYDDVWKVDSLVLRLQYQFNDWYGNMFSPQHLFVYELNEDLGSNYTPRFSNETVVYKTNSIGDILVHPNSDVPDSMKYAPKWTADGLWEYPDSLMNFPQYLWDLDKVRAVQDSGWVSSDFNAHKTTTKYWNIKLNDELAERIFNIDSTSLTQTAAFQRDYLNGVYVTIDKNIMGEGNLTRINLLGTTSSLATHLTLYFSRDYKYFNSEDEIRDTTSTYTYNFPVNVENVRFNRYEHEKDERINTDDETPSNLYIQGMAGLYSTFTIPEEVSAWADSLTLNSIHKQEDEPYRTTANIEFFLEVDTTSNVPYNKGGIQRYPLPTSLDILWQNDEGKFETPTYTAEVNGNTSSGYVFGVASSTGSRAGVGERVTRVVEHEDGAYAYEYYYRFIMSADYFNYVMRELDNIRTENDWDISDTNSEDYQKFIAEYHRLFKTQFFLGPNSTTDNFRRVKLYSATSSKKPLKMNIKYYHYIPR